MSTASFGQIADLLQLKRSVGYVGELVCCSTNGEDHTWVKSIYVSWRNERTIECRLDFDDGERSEYWTFNVGSFRPENGVVTADLSNITLDDATGWAYVDDEASGTYTFNEKDKLETLKIKFHAHKNEMDVAISWKVPELLAGKTYIARIRESCSKTSDGGYMTYTYIALTFDVGMVIITEYSTDTRDYSDKRIISEGMYGYTEQDGNITILGFDRYGILSIQEGKLVGQEKILDARFKGVVFER